MNNLKSLPNESVLIQGGNNNDNVGIQYISKGGQQFASEKNYLFFTTSKSEISYQVKTNGGIVLDNARNKLDIQPNYLRMGTLNYEFDCIGKSKYRYGGLIEEECDGGIEKKISGGNLNIKFMENRLKYNLEMYNGDINYLKYNNFNIAGITTAFKNRNFAVNSDKIALCRGDYGIDVGEDIIMSTDNHCRIYTINGSLSLLTRNGEKILLENERPNGEIVLKGSNINGKLLVDINFIKYDCKNIDFSVYENAFINSNNLQIKNNLTKMDAENIVINTLDIFLNSRNIKLEKFGNLSADLFYINSRNVKMENEMISIVSDNIRLKGDKIDLEWGENKLEMDKSLKYENKDSLFEVNGDELKMIGGNMGILLTSDRGGIKLGGELQWINFGTKLLESSVREKNIRMGNKNWDVEILGMDVKIYGDNMVMEGERVERRFGENLELIDEDAFRWVIGDSMIFLSKESFFVKKNEMEIKIGEKIELVGDVKLGELFLEKIHIEKDFIFAGDLLMINDANIKLNGELIQIQSKNIEIAGEFKNIKLESYVENIGDYSGVIKGIYNLNLAGNNYIKNNGELLEIGENVKICTIECKNNNVKIGGEKLEMKNEEIIIGDESNNFLQISKNGLEGGSNYAISFVTNKVFTLNANVLKLDGEKASIAMESGYMNLLGRGINMIGRKLYMGWDRVMLKDKQIVIGGGNSWICMEELSSSWEGDNMRLKGKNMDVLGDKIKMQGENLLLSGDYLWLKGEKTGIKLGEKLEISGIFEIENEGKKFEVNNGLKYEDNRGLFEIGEKGLILRSGEVEYGVEVNVRGEVGIYPSKSIILESTVGDVKLKTSTNVLWMDGIGNKINMESKNIFLRGSLYVDGEKGRITFGSLTLDSGNMYGKIGEIELELEKGIRINGGRFGYFGKSTEMEVEMEIKMRSERYGQFMIEEEGINIETSKNFSILGENSLAEMQVDFSGNCKITIGKKLEIGTNKELMILGEEKIVMGSTGDVSIGSKGKLKLDGKEYEGKYEEMNLRWNKGIMEGEVWDVKMRQIKLQQEGLGEIDIRSEGKIRLQSVIEGNRGDVMEIVSQNNTHDSSINMRSEMGGVKISGKMVNLEGRILLNGIKIDKINGGLKLDGFMETTGIKIGNICIENNKIICREKEILKLKNMDLELDGELTIKAMRCERIGGKRIEMNGLIRVNNGMEIRGNGGIEMNGIMIGNWERDNRTCVKIDMKDKIWNEGIRIEGDGIGLNANKCKIQELQLTKLFANEIKEYEEYEMEEIIENMDNKGEILDLIGKMLALIKWQNRRLKKIEKI